MAALFGTRADSAQWRKLDQERDTHAGRPRFAAVLESMSATLRKGLRTLMATKRYEILRTERRPISGRRKED